MFGFFAFKSKFTIPGQVLLMEPKFKTFFLVKTDPFLVINWLLFVKE